MLILAAILAGVAAFLWFLDHWLQNPAVNFTAAAGLLAFLAAILIAYHYCAGPSPAVP